MRHLGIATVRALAQRGVGTQLSVCVLLAARRFSAVCGCPFRRALEKADGSRRRAPPPGRSHIKKAARSQTHIRSQLHGSQRHQAAKAPPSAEHCHHGMRYTHRLCVETMRTRALCCTQRERERERVCQQLYHWESKITYVQKREQLKRPGTSQNNPRHLLR